MNNDTLTRQVKQMSNEARSLKAQFLALNTAGIADWTPPTATINSPTTGGATGRRWRVIFTPTAQEAVPLVNYWLDCDDIENRGIYLEQQLQVQPGVLEIRLPYIGGSNWVVRVTATSLAQGNLSVQDLGEYYG